MKYLEKGFLFAFGGYSYMTLELIWRGRSHGSMFLAGGSCFLLLGALQKATPRMNPALRAVMGAGVISLLELGAGLLFNRRYQVWDYRNMPLNLTGQICLPFSMLWVPVGWAAMELYKRSEMQLRQQRL